MANEAAAYAALEAGVGVVAGYPGTPSSEVVETVARLRAQGVAQGVHVEWSTNEKAALEVAFGASLSGARALFTCKQMGLNVASDALLSLNYVGCKGGLVLYVADDPGPISSQTEQDTRRFAAFAKVPVLDPANPDQLYQMMLFAFDLSERYGTPVVVRPTTRVCHASTFFDVPESTEARPVPQGGFKKDDARWVIFPARSYRAHQEINDRLKAISHEFSVYGESNGDRDAEGDCACEDVVAKADAAFQYGAAEGESDPQPDAAAGGEGDFQSGAAAEKGAGAPFNAVYESGEEPLVGIVAGGVSVAYVREALLSLGSQGCQLPAYRFMQVGTPFPFPEEAALRFAEGLDRILVFEELDYVLEDEFLKLAGRHRLPVSVSGKLDGTTRDRGENSTENAQEVLTSFFGLAHSGLSNDVQSGENPDPPVRPPVLCAGCPHRGSFYAVKTALRKYRGANRAVLCGDIGCYTLGNAKPLDAVDTCLCMGGGITMAQGTAAAEPGRKVVAFVGDSTFFASGLTGVANAVYNNHDITICVLDNSTTAMTGSQPHPGTGATLMGTQSEPIDIEAVLRALGVKHIGRANAFELGEAKTAARKAIEFAGPSAVIFEGPCIQLTKPQVPVTVDAQACTGCSGCVKAIGCPALSVRSAVLANGGEAAADADMDVVDAPGKLHVDTSLCWGCNLCVAVCPFGAIRKGVDAPC